MIDADIRTNNMTHEEIKKEIKDIWITDRSNKDILIEKVMEVIKRHEKDLKI